MQLYLIIASNSEVYQSIVLDLWSELLRPTVLCCLMISARLRSAEQEREDRTTLYDVVYGKMRENIVLQRLIVIAQLPHDLTDRRELGAHYENLNFQLSKRHIWDHITGLLLIYPTCLLHVIESSSEILISVLKDLKVKQQQPDSASLEAKIVFTAHNLQTRLFQQWSWKVLNADQVAGNDAVKGHEEDDDATESLICTVLSALQNLSEHLDISKKIPPGSVLDETPELIVPQSILEKLLGRIELNSPQQYLQMYNSPLNISIDIGQVNLRSFLPTV
ncbi:testis-expressed protein 47 [Leuresthes tenuis]|uniref:testis-expressed protein 47 n=1 Tax=Leuresthes tenuis TaxID=355514 RepID=UPI003B50186B